MEKEITRAEYNAAFWWAIAGIVLIVCERMLPGVILVFFGFGALIAALVAWLFPVSLAVQMAVFIVASVVSLMVLRRYLKNIFSGRAMVHADGQPVEDGLKGATGTVIEAIFPGKSRRISLNGTVGRRRRMLRLRPGTNLRLVFDPVSR